MGEGKLVHPLLLARKRSQKWPKTLQEAIKSTTELTLSPALRLAQMLSP